MKSIEFKHIVKRFGNLYANDEVSFSIEMGKVHCIVGENGAGKSTLMKVLFGVYKQNSGEIFINGEKVNFKSPLDAIKYKIGMLYQHFMLIDDFTVLENVILGSEICKTISINFDKTNEILLELIEKYKLGLNLNAKINNLSVSEQQKVELLKILYRNSEIIVFDEPTAVLSPSEIAEFLNIIRRFKSEGKTIIMITHKLNEVRQIADWVTVMRRGKVVYETDKGNLNIATLGKEMVGNINLDTDANLNFEKVSKDEILVEFKSISYKNGNMKILNDINMILRSGRIYGICGIEGNGQNEIIDIILGFVTKYNGQMYKSYKEVSLVPDDRTKKGFIKEFTIAENVALKILKNNFYTKIKLDEIAEKVISNFDIRTPSKNAPMSNLSGGNQQKVIIAREILCNNEIQIYFHPTRGVDFKASEYVHKKIVEQRNKGKALLVISSDLDELFLISDKLGVLSNGNLLAEFNKDDLSTDNERERNDLLISIGKLMAGIKNE